MFQVQDVQPVDLGNRQAVVHVEQVVGVNGIRATQQIAFASEA